MVVTQHDTAVCREVVMNDELRPIGPGRYAFTMTTPWGQAVPAEVILATVAGWPERPESRDPRWAAHPVGPIILAIRLVGVLPTAKPMDPAPGRCASGMRLPFSPVPAEWN